MIDEALYSVLTTDSGVSALVGTRVYPGYAPQEPTFPFVVFKKVSALGALAHDGPIGIARGRFQFDCYGATVLASKTLAEKVRIALHGYSGTIGGEEILKSERINEIDGFDFDVGAVVSVDFEISYREQTS